MHQFRKMVPIGILARRLSIIDLYIIQQKVFCSLLKSYQCRRKVHLLVNEKC